MLLPNMAAATERRLRILFWLSMLAFGGALAGHIWSTPPADQAPRPAAIDPGSTEAVDRWLAVIDRIPDHAVAHAQLGQAYLQRARETGDAAFYPLAEMAFARALAIYPGQFDAELGEAQLLLARHDFQAARDWALAARQAYPYNSAVLAVLVDAEVESGAYEAAWETVRELNALRPGLAAFTRLSYVYELHGRSDEALAAMAAAVDVAVAGSESWSWSVVQLGALHFRLGDWETAVAAYESVLGVDPDYPYALAGLAAVHAARGDLETAVTILEPLVDRYPLPQFAIQLGELYQATGDEAAAARQYDLVRAIQRLNEAAGQNVDLEMALFEANHGTPQVARDLAERVYARRPTVFAADTLAWALYQNGEYEAAARSSDAARRLGTREALFLYHGGMIALANGDASTGYDFLREALELNPAFNTLAAARARSILAAAGR